MKYRRISKFLIFSESPSLIATAASNQCC